MKKVLFIHHGTLTGGAPLSLLYTAQGVQQNDFDVTIGLVRYEEDLIQFYKSNGFNVIDMSWIYCYYFWSASPQPFNKLHTYSNILRGLFRWNRSLKKTIEFFKDNKYDLVHLNSVVLVNTATALLKLQQKFVWHVREYGVVKKGFRTIWFERKLIQANATIFLSQAERESWIGNIKKGFVIHNFVDIDKFNSNSITSNFRKEYGISDNLFLLLFVGGFKAHKGIDVLIDTLIKLKKKGCKFKCIIPGVDLDNLASSIWYKKIVDNNLQEECIILNFITDIRHLYKTADVLLFPATLPHFARPVVESAAMEKPSIAANLEPMNELIDNYKTGLLFEPNNSEDLLSKIELLLGDPKLCNEMGKNGRIKVLESFNYEKQIGKIIQIYNVVLNSQQ